jgi:hypothetical protein
MMFDFSNFILNIQFDVIIKHQNVNFYLKNHVNSFDEIYDVRFRAVYLK